MSSLSYRSAPAWLIAGGILLTWGAALLVTPEATSVWSVGLVSAIGVGAPNGGLVWLFRRQQRRERERAIEEVREMMADRLKNQLAVIGMYAPLAQDAAVGAMAVEGIHHSIREINGLVDGLSIASLGTWQTHYQLTLQPHATRYVGGG